MGLTWRAQPFGRRWVGSDWRGIDYAMALRGATPDERAAGVTKDPYVWRVFVVPGTLAGGIDPWGRCPGVWLDGEWWSQTESTAAGDRFMVALVDGLGALPAPPPGWRPPPLPPHRRASAG